MECVRGIWVCGVCETCVWYVRDMGVVCERCVCGVCGNVCMVCVRYGCGVCVKCVCGMCVKCVYGVCERCGFVVCI